MKKKGKILLFITIIVLLGIIILPLQGYSVNEKKLVKDWSGDCGAVSDIVVTNLDNGQILWSGPTLLGFPSQFPNLLHNQNVSVTWTDWRGPQSETFMVSCDQNNILHVTNQIPFPKFTEQHQT